jgi:hypothetical protein
MASYTTIDNPELYFQCKIYTGDGNDNRAITFDGEEDMQPNLLWFKNRGAAAWHNIYDSVRGANKALASNANNAEESRSDTLDSFDSNGFTVGNDTSQDPDGYNTNASSNTYVCWAWKESADAGMDIVSYTGNATNRTISHSLSAVPHWIIIKNRESTSSSAEHWLVYHKSISNTHGLLLNQTDAKSDDATYFQDTDPTSSVFSIGTADRCNKNNEDNIAFLWSEKQGFSKFGSYRGNGSTNGPFVQLNFRPAWLLIKRSSAAGVDWILHDNKRAGFNINDDYLAANTSAVEVTGNTFQNLDLLSNGFKIRGAGTGTNTSGATYVYMAFAESPFVNSKGVPNNAR